MEHVDQQINPRIRTSLWAMSRQVILTKKTEVAFDIFKRLAEEFNQTLLIVTHDQSFADRTHRIINIEDGRIVS